MQTVEPQKFRSFARMAFVPVGLVLLAGLSGVCISAGPPWMHYLALWGFGVAMGALGGRCFGYCFGYFRIALRPRESVAPTENETDVTEPRGAVPQAGRALASSQLFTSCCPICKADSGSLCIDQHGCVMMFSVHAGRWVAIVRAPADAAPGNQRTKLES